VPALMEILVDHLEAGRGSVPGLRLALLSGDWIPVPLADRIRGRCGAGVRVVSLGGATEASIWSILYEIGTVDPAWPSIPYGRPMANQSFHVLDEALAPRPVWVPGELWIGGVGLARGYWRDPEKTAASFAVHPRTGERLYRTGDMGRRLPDGTLEFLGREDAQVKVQGHRIELGEVEAALLQHSGVRGAAAAAVGRPQGGRRLVAWYVPEPDEDPGAEALRGFLAAKLPSYMVPVELRRLDALPLTANGKVDRRALAAAGAPGEALESGVIDPRTPTEERLAALWAEALDLPRVGVTQTFYQLGGDSLLATRVLARVREGFEIDLPMRTFFEAPTVAELAAVVDRLRAEVGGEQDKIRRALESLSGLSEDQIDNALAELAGEA
jgi:acyl carrier protein